MVVLPNTDPSTKCTASFIVALAHAGLNERSRSRTLQKRPADRSTAARGSVRRAYLEPGKGKRGSMLSSASCGPAHLRGARGRLHLGNQPFFAASRFVSWDPRKICLFSTILFSFSPHACPRRNRTRNATSARVNSGGHILPRRRHEHVRCEEGRHRFGRCLHAGFMLPT